MMVINKGAGLSVIIVRPLVEYASAVWDPFTKKNINKIEMVQRRATRWTLNSYHNTSSVTGMMNHLRWPSWPTLQIRQSEAQLGHMYKMVHGLVAINIGLYAKSVLRPTLSGLFHKYCIL